MHNESYYDLKRGIRYPDESKELAEFIGIMFGDGSMNTYNNKGNINSAISIAGNSINDKEYLTKYVSNLIKKLFNITPQVYFKKNQNTMCLSIGSKGLVNFLQTKGINKGKKLQLKIPDWISSNEEYMKYFIRGITDTDGCIAIKKKHRKVSYYPTIKLCSIDKNLIISIKEYLDKIGITSYILLDSKSKSKGKIFKISAIYINGYPKLVHWMSTIGFSNSKNLNKIPQIEEQRKTLKRSYNSIISRERSST